MFFVRNSWRAIQRAHPGVDFRKHPTETDYDIHVHVPGSECGPLVSAVGIVPTYWGGRWQSGTCGFETVTH